MQKTFNEKRMSIPLETGSLRIKACLSLENTNSSSECIGKDNIIARDKVNVRVALFNIIEPANDMVRSCIVSGNVKVVSMDV